MSEICTVCHQPRDIWADDGKICWICGLRMLGELPAEGVEATPEQLRELGKWIIDIPRKALVEVVEKGGDYAK